MEISRIILIFTAMLLLASAAYPVSARFRIPFSALLLLIGYLSGVVIGLFGIDSGLRWHHFKDIVFNVFLPVLIFESALNINIRLLVRNLTPILLLAIPALLLTTLITASILYFSIDHSAFPWVAALICGVLLSATDPVAVLDMFKQFNINPRLTVVMEGESLFNDAIAIVLFSLLLAIALEPGQQLSWHTPILQFLYVMFGGAVVGIIAGLLVILANRWVTDPMVFTGITLGFAYLTFLGAKEWLHVSGIVAVLGYGLCLGWETRKHPEENRFPLLLSIWQFFAFMANAFVFLLVGFTFTLSMFTDMWLAMLFGILAVLLARAIGIYTSLPFIGRIPGVEPLNRQQHFIIYWGGLRGAVAIALALSLPLELDSWYTIQSITYGVVFFSVFVQAPLLHPVLQKLKSL
ncbi:sodium:proton antiporter [Thiohalophilus sp.]|uniref:cation:proton antiporter n=1 Tax=Thiohalophilus sp. TaxID=3028392 RepID=UPI002ACEC8FC|nr:sodium:proton antiporter [Thiohalophilus sp.]MDZ7661092.1 sodium:proton antiporter [Thiohalophilus sp.]